MTPQLDNIAVEQIGPLAILTIDRPEKANALDLAGWNDLGRAFRWVSDAEDIRVAVLAGRGRHFCAGLDPSVLDALRPGAGEHPALAAERLRRDILRLQATVTAVETCRKPVIAAVHGACIGGGLDIAAACDIRLCSDDATFCVREVDLAIVADMGVLQRLPQIIGEGRARDLALTARTLDAAEAERIGLVTGRFRDHAALDKAALDLAARLAAKSPLAVQGTKSVMTRRLRPAIEDGLEHVATLNAGIMFSPDLDAAVAAMLPRKKS